MLDYECCICKGTVSAAGGEALLDPCALIIVSNIDLPREDQKEQQFFCHFECFRRLVNNDGIMYIMDIDAPTIGEIEQDEENWSDDDRA